MIFVLDTEIPYENQKCGRNSIVLYSKCQVYTDKSREFIKARQDLHWIHDTNTPHRSESNEIAERVVKEKKTAIATFQHDFPEEW